LISWKYSFKRLNEEYEIANKKKTALENLFEKGKISQATRDSFNEDINMAIIEIQNQQKALLDKMQGKTQELHDQVKTLEMLLANYEIQHVVGEIEDEIYQREMTLLSTGLESTKNELDVIKQAILQLCPPEQVVQAPEAPAAPEIVAPAIDNPVEETVAMENVAIETDIVEPVSVETEFETAQVENPILEIENVSAEPAQLEPTLEIPVEIIETETSPVEASSVEAETIEVIPMENAPVEEPIVDSAQIETSPEDFTNIETASVELEQVIAQEETPELSVVEEVQIEEAAIDNPTEQEVEVIAEPTPDFSTDPEITEPSIEEPIINIDAETVIEKISETEQLYAEEEISIVPEVVTEVAVESEEPVFETEAAPEQPAVPLQVFEVATEPESIDTTLDTLIEPAMEPVIVEETMIPAHPLEAPQGAQPEIIIETDQTLDETAVDTEASEETIKDEE
jgi:hypothetical protein